ncbi:repressor LexA [Limisphaera ngatamarikiensis]|uniref:Repressor LexA n=1 Tax=Limisphaera ngatamarikiensis TaxID=1324935 RepID=A0A6M1RFH8_9BACT|nr:transcriptional repressor LexA [Limisphaera ngatamarikiensis]NGO38798.1 repressor LexA [Limisphaera ngatamarikiensis]
MNKSSELTPRQREILEYLAAVQQERGVPPTLREIAARFGFRSMNAAAAHIRALRRKGWVEAEPHRARTLRLTRPGHARKPLIHIPLYGSIPAGFADDRIQEARGCISVDIETLGLDLRPNPRLFALEVRGDSMIGRHILEGDIVILEHGRTPRPGDVVAALIDNESTLKTFVMVRGKPCLRAENPKYPDLIPARELVIQGVMIALIRKVK